MNNKTITLAMAFIISIATHGAYAIITTEDCAFLCETRVSGYTASCRAICNTCLKSSTTTSTTNGVETRQTNGLVTYCPSIDNGVADCSCDITTTYRCAIGYYGTPTSATSGCTACPNGGTTKSAGATSVSSCYIPDGTAFTDDTGSGTYSGDCYY